MTTAGQDGAPRDRTAGPPAQDGPVGDTTVGTAVPGEAPAGRRRGPPRTALLLLTPLALVLLVVGGLLVARADRAGVTTTYRANGVSFDYPARWHEGRIRNTLSGDRPEWTVGVGDEDAPYDVVIVSAYRLTGRVADAGDVAELKDDADQLMRRIYQGLGGAQEAGPEETTVAGMSGFRAYGRGSVEGVPVRRTDVLVFGGSVMYQFQCQHTDEHATGVRQACDQVLASFTVHDPDAGTPAAAAPGSTGAPAATTPSPTRTGAGLSAAERGWLDAISAYKTKVETEFFQDRTMTPKTMRRYADLLRGCSRLAGRMPSPRLRPVHRLLLGACAPHDKAASCFATAARIGAPVIGTEQERVFDRSIDCGYLGRAEGVEPLGDAIREGEKIRLATD